MASIAIIAFKHADGLIEATVVRSEGYPEHAGHRLNYHYHSAQRAHALMRAGAYRTIEATLDRCGPENIPCAEHGEMDGLFSYARREDANWIYIWGASKEGWIVVDFAGKYPKRDGKSRAWPLAMMIDIARKASAEERKSKPPSEDGLDALELTELQDKAKEMGLPRFRQHRPLPKHELVRRIRERQEG